MLRAIADARSEILLEMYRFGSDRTGQRFADALARRAAEGLRVCIVYDAVGSWEASNAVFEQMRAAGCVVHEYNPIAPWRRRFRLGVVNRRDHRKLLVVDGHVGFTGGVNIGDPWASNAEGGGNWRDDMIRIEGPAAGAMRDVFMHTFRVLDDTAQTHPMVTLESVDALPVQVLANDYYRKRRAIRRAYLRTIRNARRYIYVSNSYFVPDWTVRRTLAAAAARGADVRVLLPGTSDVPAVWWAGRALYGWLMKRGIRLFEWQPTILHAKSAVVDDYWSTVGTYNLDYLSWRTNLEINVAVQDQGLAAAMKSRFLEDLSHAVEVEPRAWGYRPLANRLLERLFFTFRRFL
jgi:cardiolipin synthase